MARSAYKSKGDGRGGRQGRRLRTGVSRAVLDREAIRDGSGPSGLSLRPRYASTLIVLDDDGTTSKKNLKVLMGRRHRRHKFMPGLYVFPGGRVDPTDGDLHSLDELDSRISRRIYSNLGSRATHRRVRALGLACLRETYEETGVLVGVGSRASRAPDIDTATLVYGSHSVVPTLSPLRLVARAITPPGRPRRFDTWFFATWSSHISKKLRSRPSDELEGVRWLTIESALKLELPLITRTILEELRERLVSDPKLSPTKRVPFFHLHYKKFVREMI